MTSNTISLPDMKPVGAGEPFSYFALPRLLLKSPRFKGLHKLAAILYGLMLSRLSLSAKREDEFTDAEGRLYILYTVDQVQEDLRCARATAVKVLRQLVEYGLLEKQRRGQGKPNLLFVKDFRAAGKAENVAESTNRGPKSSNKDSKIDSNHVVNFKKLKYFTSRSQKSLLLEVQSVNPKYKDPSNLDLRIHPSPLTPPPAEESKTGEGWMEGKNGPQRDLLLVGTLHPIPAFIQKTIRKIIYNATKIEKPRLHPGKNIRRFLLSWKQLK